MTEQDHSTRQLKIVAALQAARLSPATLRWVSELVMSSADRTPPNTRGHPVVIQSRKMGMPVAARSEHLEAARLLELEADADVLAFFTEVAPVPITNPASTGGGKHRQHRPDIVVLYRDRVVLEVLKHTDDIRAEMEDPKEAWKWARDDNGDVVFPPLVVTIASERIDAGVRVVTQHHVSQRLVGNLKYLWSYVRAAVGKDEEAAMKRVAEATARREGSTIADLISACEGDVDAVQRAIAHHVVYVNLRRHTVRDHSHTPVFSSAQAASLVSTVEANTTVPPHAVPPAVPRPLRIGTPLTVGGVAAKVVFVGRDSVRIEVVEGETAGDQTEIPRAEAEAGRAPLDDSTVLYALRARVTEVWTQAGPEALAIGRGRALLLLRDAAENGTPLGFSLHVEDGEAVTHPRTPSRRTVERWKAEARRAAQESGCAMAGLVPGFHRRGNRGDHFAGTLETFVFGCLDRLMVSTPQAQTEQFRYEQILQSMEAQRVRGPTGRFHISHTLYTKLRKRYGTRRITLASEGLAAANQLSPPSERLQFTSPRHGTYFGERCHMDHSPLSVSQVCALIGVDDTQLSLDTCWLSVLIDSYTRTVLAFVVSFHTPNWTTVATLLRICVQRHGRLPSELVLDNAPEFRCHAMNQFCQWSGMRRHYRMLETPQGGGPMERMFGLTETQVCANLPGATRHRNRNLFYAARMPPAEHARLCLEATALVFTEFYFSVYDNLTHPALGASPAHMRAASAATRGRRDEDMVQDMATFRVLTMLRPRSLAGTAKVQKKYGVQINGFRYWHAAFDMPSNEGRSIPVRVDPDEMWVVYALVIGVGGQRMWVRARCSQLEEHDYLPEIAHRFAVEIAQNIALARFLNHRLGRRAIVNFVARYRHIPQTAVELAQTCADARVRAILLGEPAELAPQHIATDNLPDTPTAMGRDRAAGTSARHGEDAPGTGEEVILD